MPRRLAVEGAVVGCEQILGERQFRHHLLELDPEPPAHAVAVLRQPVSRLEPHAVFGRCHLSPLAGARGGSPRPPLSWGSKSPIASGSEHAELPGNAVHRLGEIDVEAGDVAVVMGSPLILLGFIYFESFPILSNIVADYG